MMLISEKRASMVCARAMKKAAAAMPRWTGDVARASGRRDSGGMNGQTGMSAPPNDAKWRRITGMTSEIERFMDSRERRAAISRLVRWLKRKTNSKFQNQNSKGNDKGQISRSDDEIGRAHV